ncbi:MAG: hypothetical protein IJT87_08945 [Ruminiclostridium sp.]|nr:hypothetical protein [Ruminiclostridium sp.]
MKKIEKLIAVLLSAILMICVLPKAAFADAPNGVFVSEASPERGSGFTVTISVPPAENADTASVKLSFDKNAFEVVEWAPEVPGGFINVSDDMVVLLAINVIRSIDLSEGLTLTAKMRVKDSAPDGRYPFVLEEHSFCYVDETGYDFIEVWFPETISVTVTVGDPAAGAGEAPVVPEPAEADLTEVGELTDENTDEQTAAAEETENGGGNEVSDTSDTGDTAETANAVTGEITEFYTAESSPETEAAVDTTRLAETSGSAETAAPAVTQAPAGSTGGSSVSFDGSTVIFIIIIALAVLLTAAFIAVMILTKNKPH